MAAWTHLLQHPDWCHGKGAFPLPAYSEFTPPPWVAAKPYGPAEATPSPRDGEHGWVISEYEHWLELRPGLEYIARNLLGDMVRLGRGEAVAGLSSKRLKGNPYWPAELAQHAGKLAHERYVLLTSLALSRTQDDKGRVRWTLFGASEQGPGKAFWRGFFTGPKKEVPRDEAMGFFAELLSRCYGVQEKVGREPKKAGVRILSAGRDDDFRYWNEGPLPAWSQELVFDPKKGLDGVRYLLTFRPFATLPADIQNAYVSGKLHLWPFPGSLVYWGVPGFRKLAKQLPLAMQLSLATQFPRFNDLHGIRIPQGGVLNEKVPPDPETAGIHRPLFARTHRWQKVQRHEDEVALIAAADPVTRVLFSTDAEDIDLYNKPMARNVQIWTHDYRLVLDGPNDVDRKLARAEEVLAKGGTFGYRFLFPPMRVGLHEVYWQRPLAAFGGAKPDHLPPRGFIQLDHAPLGYLTAYHLERPDMARPVELWPVLAKRRDHLDAIDLFRHENLPRKGHTITNVRSFLECRELLGVDVPPSLARAHLAAPREQTLAAWLDSLPGRSTDPTLAKAMVKRMKGMLAKKEPAATGEGLTFGQTATREFEEAYWRTIAFLAHGKFQTKSNADCVRDEPSRKAVGKTKRDLDVLADYLLEQHAKAIAAAGVKGAWAGEHRFSWRTDFEFDWMGGWKKSQAAPNQERNLVVRIPGKDSSQAVILADHYDTAYMHDRYYLFEGGTGARIAAKGADDNHSATAMLLLATPMLLELSKAGKLACDVWLVHLTGEEFPSDCLGARHLAQALVQKTLAVKAHHGPTHDLSAVRVRGLYVCDMIAHNNQRDRYVFQLAPGEGPESLRLAKTAHEATLDWNALAKTLNKKAPRKGTAEPARREDPADVPGLFPHATLRDEVRTEWDPRSTLFNTDGQIFSDVGVPVVLFMEDYDINRKGYHDMFDTMGNIDLDYGAALAAIAIESAARLASQS